MLPIFFRPTLFAAVVAWLMAGSSALLAEVRVASFSSDITIPAGHRCMGILPTKAATVDDPLEAIGLVLWGSGEPVVLLALDWCEVRNGAYDQWREALAEAANTSRERVLVASLHQHDAPVVDSGAQSLLDGVGMRGELYDVDFHAACIAEVTAAMKRAMVAAETVTHVGVGAAAVEKIASNRRVVHPDGSVHYDRNSRTAADSIYASSDPGQIDSRLTSISFWNGDRELVVLSAYATHPMSRYGEGRVSADFVGLARRRRQLETPETRQIYFSGCSGDVTAGKYNDGSPAARGELIDRLYQAMARADASAAKTPIDDFGFRCEQFHLPFATGEAFSQPSLTAVLQDAAAPQSERILAAMGLSSRERIDRGQPIDLPCLDLSAAQIVLFPGETFVGYQLMAQELSPNCPVMAIGYGECWPGYVPTELALFEGFEQGWRWVTTGCEAILRDKLQQVLQRP